MTTDTKYFTPTEARSTLPLVKKIVKDILDTSKEMKLIADDFGIKEINNNPQLRKMADEIDGFISELEEVGCFYKDWNFTIGLVDFPAVIDNREVMLCWKSDEDDIKFYHDVDSGYSGRKPIPEEYF